MTESVCRILLVDATKKSRDELSYALLNRGHQVIAVENGDHALNVLDREPVDILISDLDEPGVEGMKLLQVALHKNPHIGIIMMIGRVSVETAVAAMKEGAYDFLPKPIDVPKLEAEIDQIIDRQQILYENLNLHRQLDSRYAFPNIIGKSAPMQHIFKTLNQIADTRATVLIYGESGTGKELVAHAIHSNSSRRQKPFVPLNCVALSEGVIESELFGHEKGAFTGALTTRKGRFELADGGTLFLDEVGELSLSTQVKLLRVLQEWAFERVGGSKTLRMDVRLIAATNRNLEEAIRQGRFREDLYYRLKVVTLTLPPLRERKEDIPLLIEAFLKRFSERDNKLITGISPKAMEALGSYDWPGNVRELENCIEGMVVMATGRVLELEEVPEYIRRQSYPPIYQMDTAGDSRRQVPLTSRSLTPPQGSTPLLDQEEGLVGIRVGMSRKEAEKQLFRATLAACRYNKTKTAQVLQIGLRTLFRKLKEYELE